MRILYWTELFRPDIGGVEVISVPLIHELQARGHEFLAVATRGRLSTLDQTVFANIPVRRFPFHETLLSRHPSRLRALLTDIAQLKQSFRPDLIHVNTAQPGLFFHLHTRHAYRCPVLFTMHEPLLTSDPNSLLGLALRTSSWVVGVSNDVVAHVRGVAPEITSRSSVLLYGVRMPLIMPTPLPFAVPGLLCIGRLVPQKGFDLVVEAMVTLLERFPNLRLTIAGDGEVRAALQDQAVRLGVSDAVRFEGWIAPAQVPSLIRQATIVIVPSRWHETFGLVALEAAQMARPVIASRVGGLPEVVIDQETGFLVESNSSYAIAEAVSRLLADPDEASRLGRAARRRAMLEFSHTRMVDAYERLYEQLVEKAD